MNSQRSGGSGRAAQARLDGWLGLADRGWRLFPVRPGSKVPAISQWSQRATDDPDRLARFFCAHPTHNAGIACGPSGLLIVDCDVAKDDQAMTRWRDGAAVFDDLGALHGGTPPTWTVATPSGGQHLYYVAPADRKLGNTSRILGPLLDTRGDGGQVLAPGSLLPAGGYELLDDTDPAPLPGWLATQLTPPPAAAAATAVAPTSGTAAGPVLSARQAAYVASAVAAETERVRRAGRGGHNTAVFTAANALGQLVGAGALDRADAEAAVTAAAEHICAGPCDCTPREVAASIRSGLERGTRNPRRLPDGASTPIRLRVPGGEPMATTDDHTSNEEGASGAANPAPVLHDHSVVSNRVAEPSPAERIAARFAAENAARELVVTRLASTGYVLVGPSAQAWVSDPATGHPAHPATDDEQRILRQLDGAGQLVTTDATWESDSHGGAEIVTRVTGLVDADPFGADDVAGHYPPPPVLGEVQTEVAESLQRSGDLDRVMGHLAVQNRNFGRPAERLHDMDAQTWDASIATLRSAGYPITTTTFAGEDRAANEIGYQLDLATHADPWVASVSDDRSDDRDDERGEQSSPAEEMALWAPAGAAEETLSPRQAAQRLAGHGFREDEAAAAVVAYLDDVGRYTGTDLRRWGLDSHDLDVIVSADQAGRAAAAAHSIVPPAPQVPEPRTSPDVDESARRAQLAQWHADDHTAQTSDTHAAAEGIDR